MSQIALLMIGIVLYLLANYIFQEDLEEKTPERPATKFPSFSMKHLSMKPPSWHKDHDSKR
ncbi:MAG: hypothetical protein EP343_15240 [Deltaproteobacteria bacterium]|nr:MAG: hypothetical protein EP343_15240 [Deltaproteobacteria bacterium]